MCYHRADGKISLVVQFLVLFLVYIFLLSLKTGQDKGHLTADNKKRWCVPVEEDRIVHVPQVIKNELHKERFLSLGESSLENLLLFDVQTYEKNEAAPFHLLFAQTTCVSFHLQNTVTVLEEFSSSFQPLFVQVTSFPLFSCRLVFVFYSREMILLFK